MTNNIFAKNYAEQILNQAGAVYHLFEDLRADKNANVDILKAKYAEESKLTKNQERYFSIMGERAKKVKGIINYLEQRFGVDEKGYFLDHEGLHRLLNSKRKIKVNYRAKSYNIGIGFEKDVWMHANKAGFVEGSFFNQLAVPLEQTIERLEKGRRTNCLDFAFYHPSLSACGKRFQDGRWGSPSPVERLMVAIFGENHLAEKGYNVIINHEMRHIIDNVISAGYTRYVETPAYMYSDFSLMGIDKDYKKVHKTIAQILSNSKNTLERLKQLNGPSILIKKSEELVEKHEQELADLKGEMFPVAKTLSEIFKNKYIKKKENIKMFSYVFSTNKSEDMFKVLNVLKDYYSQKNTPLVEIKE